jgi:anti-anti-sigma factor
MPQTGTAPHIEAAQIAPLTFVVTARGDLDDAASIELRDLLFPLVAADGATVIVDLLGVHDLADAPLGVVISAAHMLDRRGRRLTLVAASRHLTELAYASGLDRIATLERSLQAGIAHAH